MSLLRPRLGRLLLAIALGVLSLGSALALAGLAAWLITRAWQMPPVLDLSVAVVAVRALGISRGVFGYCERLATHDTALRAAASARQRLYARLATGPVDVELRRHSGELVARIGADVDELSDVLVRAVLPIGVAAVLGVAATAVIAVISPAAAGVLAACLLFGGVVAPWLGARAATAEEVVAAQHRSGRDVATMLALDHAPELRISGRLPKVIAEAKHRQRDWGHAIDRAAAPAAAAAAAPTAAIGVSVLGAVVAGIALASTAAPTMVAVLMLLPLSAFEATTPLPGAAVQLTRSRIAARRLRDLRSDSLAREHVSSFTLALVPGTRLAVTGPSGSGKTTLLMAMAGADATFFAEDAHLFATTVRDNLLVVRGDCSDDEMLDALEQVGLGKWLAGLPDGLDTVLVGGAQAVSAGQRRRLLVARALISRSPTVLLDEPTEHLDAADAEPLLRALLDPADGLFTPERTVVVATHQLPTDNRCPTLHIGADR
jgi:ATP-binding cassette, subfamily C, bacterial CydC